MSVKYQQILHHVALRLNALVGTQKAQIEVIYDHTLLNSGDMKSVDWPYGSLRDTIIAAEEMFVEAIADTPEHPYRTSIRAATAALINPSALPTATSTGKRIIGIWGTVYDSSDNTHCTKMPLETVLRRIRNSNNHNLIPVYYYATDSRFVYHTRTNVIIDVCTYDHDAQVTVFDGANMILPDTLEFALVCQSLALLTKDNQFAEQAAYYSKYATDALANIRATLPMPRPQSP